MGMKIIEFNKQNVEKYHLFNCIILADYTCISYNKELTSLQYLMSIEYNLALYPICVGLSDRLVRFIFREFSSFDYWLVDKSIIEDIVNFPSLSQNII